MEKQGEFLQPVPMKEFIGTQKNIQFTTKKAKILGRQLSGSSYQDVLFELEIFDDGSCDFKALSKVKGLSKKRRGDILDNLSWMESAYLFWNEGKIIKSAIFFAEMVPGIKTDLYLSLKTTKPINKLKEILSSPVATERHLSLIDELFSDIQEEVLEQNDSSDSDIFNKESTRQDVGVSSKTYLQQQFREMGEKKLKSLESQLLNLLDQKQKINGEILHKSSTLKKITDDISLLQKRITKMKPKSEALPYYFWVSTLEGKVLKPSIDGVDPMVWESAIDSVVEGINKSGTLEINLEALKSLMMSGYYRIVFGELNESGEINIIPPKEMGGDVVQLLGEFTLSGEGLKYPGDITWSELTEKLEQLGFQKSSKFDEQFKTNTHDTQN